MRIRPLELWVFSLFLAMAGVAIFHEYQANESGDRQGPSLGCKSACTKSTSHEHV